MSYIRYTQEGTYVDIPGGSDYYLYGNGNDIEGWSYEEFAGVILHEIEDCIEDEDYREDVLDAFREEFGGIDRDFQGGVARPERAEVFCQVIDRRVDGIELRPDLHRRLRQEMTAEFGECPYCGTDVRSDTLFTEDPVCADDECEDRLWAEVFEIEYEDYVEIKDLRGDEFEDAVDELKDT